ncbi:MAG: cupredoxin family copper-binding protein [Candidatus Diapherotrites archaeon]
MKKIIFIISLLLIAILTIGCIQQQDNQNPPPTPAPGNQGSSVSIKDFAFNPSTLTVKAGTTVSWVNEDSVIHTIKSHNFNSGNLSKGDKFEFKFNDKGTFDYVCGPHPFMKGTIIVG